MANTLTGLFPVIYEALDTVSRELVGFIPAVNRDSKVERAAIGQTVTSPVAPAATAADNTPGLYAPNTGDQTIGSVSLAITKSRHVPVRWNGEETRGMNNAGTYMTTLRDQFAQAFRTLANEIEADLAALHIYASRGYGTAGTTPFGTANDMTDASNVRKILDNNGVPQGDLQLVLGNDAMANVRGKQSQLFKVNESGSKELLYTGMLGHSLQGFALRASGQVLTAVTAGTGASATTDATGYAVGATTITLASAGTGTIIAGDLISFAGDSEKYLVVTGDTNVANGGTVVLAAPGLRKAIPAAATNITVVAASTRNMAFHRNAIVLATRAPAMPIGPDGKAMDMADDVQYVTDPISGLTFEIAIYRQFLQLVYHVRIAWGVKANKPEHIALLLG